MNRIIKTAAALLAMLLAAGLLFGCGAAKEGGETKPAADGSESARESAPVGTEEEENVIPLPALDVGVTFSWGRFDQDGVPENGAEPIEWTVLKEENGRYLAVSREALECMAFSASDKGDSWADSSVREWLNGEFFDGAFVAAEKELIPESEGDFIFLLSVGEAEELFEDDAARVAVGTEHAYKNGLFKTAGGGCWWWLRTPGEEKGNIAGVDANGVVSARGNSAYRLTHAVRPAMWIKPD